MKKHLFAIFTYLVTFTFSFVLVSLLTEKTQIKPTACFPSRNFTKVETIKPQTEQQLEIKELLTRDRQFGNTYFASSENAIETANLVRNMKTLDNANLPLTIRKAYAAHTLAWENFSLHLKRTKNHDDSDKDCIELNRDINETYNTLLLAAENYDVDFR